MLICADADRRVRRLVGEVETLSVQLRMMEHDRVRYHSGDTEVIARCIQMCQVSTNEISWTTDRLVAISARYVGPKTHLTCTVMFVD